MAQGRGIGSIFRQNTLLGYVVAIAAVALAAALRYQFRTVLPEAPLLFFFLAIIAAASVGGFWPGALASVLSALVGNYLFIAPTFSFSLEKKSIFLLCYFVAQGLLVSALFEGLRRAAERSAAAAEALRQTLAQRDAAEQGRQESEQRFSAIVNNAVDAIVTIDERGLIESFNPAAERQFGYTRDEVIGKNVSILMPTPYRGDHDNFLSNYLRTGQARVIGVGREVVGLRKDGTTFPMDLSVSEVRTGGRRTFTGIVHDITERKLAETHLVQAKEAAEAANRDKDQFLAMVSHELRTPLTAILGWADLLASGASDASEMTQGVETIARNARAQSRLIEDLLDISRIISGKLRLDVRPTQIDNVVDAAVDSMKHAAHAKNITLRPHTENAGLVVNGDPSRLQQVVWNLISNAIKFTQMGGIVDINVARENSTAIISVADNGPGIDPEFLPQMFTRFRQADSTSTRRHGGLGLGLSIARHLVELHGGSIEARNLDTGRGAIFTVRVPTVTPAAHEAVKKEASSAQGWQDAVLDGVHVLVVDDENDALELVARVLRRSRAQVTTVHSAAEAIAAIERSKPDVLLSDIAMPGEDGYALIRRIRQMDSPARQIPAAALTAFARTEDRRKALMAGFQSHVAKPVEPAELTAVVADLAGRGRA